MIGAQEVWGYNILLKAIEREHLSSLCWEAIQDLVERITTDDIVDGAVTNPKIATLAITLDKMSADSVGIHQIINGSVSEDKIIIHSVTNSKIGPAAVGLDKMMINSVDSPQVIAGAIDSAHLSDNAKTAFVKPTYTDIVAPTETGTIKQSEGKKFIPLGEILVGPKAILLALTVAPPFETACTATLKIYGSGLSDLTGLKKESELSIISQIIVDFSEVSQYVNLPAIISLVHCPVNPTGAAEYSGIVLEITGAPDPSTEFSYSIGPYGILDGTLVES
jgi:hypothetical protein